MALIECKNLDVGYDGKTVASNINFKLEKGDYLCIVGENGSGKSTLMRTLLGLQSAVDGEMIFADGLSKSEIGYLPQQTVVQKDFPAAVSEIVLSGCLNKCGLRPFYTKKEKQTAKENLERMGLSGFEKRCYRELSGGQQQRVLLARALCAADKLILLDEPVTGLDPKVTKQMYELIEELNKQGMSIIMITHDTQAAVKYSSHILHVAKNVFFGTTKEYLENQESLLKNAKDGEQI